MTEEKMLALDQFRRNTCGKEYALNLKKILTAKSEALSQGRQAEIKEDRQFFCSELVAKAFKVLGVLKDLQKSCTKYYPGSFEEGQQIDQDLVDGVALSPVINIVVDSANEETRPDEHVALFWNAKCIILLLGMILCLNKCIWNYLLINNS